jgi:phosphopantetheine--protein transferase-like protein
MPALPPVGNDIVDLRASGNIGKSADGRFRGRVFTEEEQSLISGSRQPDAFLWALWASKEAAYKAVSRGNPAVCSIPRQYRVVIETATGQETAGRLAGKVITPKGELSLRAALTLEWVHALVTGSDTDCDRIFRLVECLDDSEDPSTAVRWSLLREIARSFGCTVGDLSMVKDTGRPGAPSVLFRGHLLTEEVSLSHDGRFAAFAFDPATLVPAVDAPDESKTD